MLREKTSEPFLNELYEAYLIDENEKELLKGI